MQWIESETPELKKSTSELKAGIVSLVAMLSKHHRGKLWFGIKNDGTSIGQTISEASFREVSKEPATEFEEVDSMLFVARFRRKELQKGIAGRTDVTPGIEKQIAKLRREGRLLRIGTAKGGTGK